MNNVSIKKITNNVLSAKDDPLLGFIYSNLYWNYIRNPAFFTLSFIKLIPCEDINFIPQESIEAGKFETASTSN